MKSKELVSVYKTLEGEEEKFKEINCFFCKPKNMFLTPEGCFISICKTIIEKSYPSPCHTCKQDLMKEFFQIGIKRMEARGFNSQDSQDPDIKHIVKEMISNVKKESKFLKKALEENRQQCIYAMDCAEDKIIYKKDLPRFSKPIEKQSI